MQRFANILCLYSKKEDQAAWEHALHLGKHNRARLTIMDVLDRHPRDYVMTDAGAWQSMHQMTKARCLAYLQKMIAPAKRQGLKVAASVKEGIPSVVLIQEVLRQRHDLVVVSAAARKGIEELIFGSIPSQLMRKCPCPVWVIKSTQKAFARIMAAVDPDPKNRTKNKLNRKILDAAVAMASWEQSSLHVVHAWSSLPQMYLSHGHMSVDQKDILQLSHSIQLSQQQAFHALLAPYYRIWPRLKIHFIKGEPEGVIPRLAGRLKIDLVVMGTVVRTGVAGFIMGSTAEELLPRLNCSLLTLKPDGFRTPIHTSRSH
ncbi:universal stress protein [candidate division FCPU426 bacterium]|nr:universal stress protein [candidate division FCPU426 bacterium]